MEHIAIAKITGDPDNVRQVKSGKDADATLLASMKAIGLLSPIHVTPVGDDGHYRVVAGHRRFAAACRLGWDTIAAIVVKPGTDLTLIQLSENVVRADMNPLDVWVAVDRMLREGMTPAAVAAALHMPEKRVHHLRAMGTMHPSIVAAIRKNPDRMPDEREVQTICQADHATQERAFKHNGTTWWQVAAACRIAGFPRSSVRFDISAYTGEIHRDLFNDAAEEVLVDVAQAMKLQGEWREAQLEQAKSLGYLVGEIKVSQYGETSPPPGCEKDTWKSNRQPLADFKCAKAKRKEWVYTCTIDSRGAVHEVFFPVKNTAEARAASAAIADPVTKAGQKLIEAHKRQTLSDMLDELDADALMWIAGLCILERNQDDLIGVRSYVFNGNGHLHYLGPSAGRAVLETGLRAALQDTGYHQQVQMALIERMGAVFGIGTEIPATTDNLAMVKRPGLAAILRAFGTKPEEFKTQVAMRDFIRKQGETIGPSHLPALAFDTHAKLNGWRAGSASSSMTNDDAEDADDEAAGGEADEAEAA